MFRRGGSAARGTGITSGLERQGYKTGMFVQPGISEETIKERIGNKYDPDGSIALSRSNTITGITKDLTKKPLEVINKRAMQTQQKESPPRTPGELQQQLEVISQMKERFQPTTGDVIDDTMAAIASTAPDDPTKLQTFGQFLAKAGAGATGLRRQRQEQIDKFEKDATLQMIKNLSKDEKDQLFRYANERARLLNIPPEKRSTQDKQRLQFLERYLKGTPAKGLTSERLTQDNINRVLGSKKGRRLDMGEVNTVASTLTKMQKGETGGISGGIISRNAFTGEEGATSAGAEVGRNYINPTDGFIYRYDGKGKFTKVWPSK